jgi:hypothetical protein
MTHKYEKVEHMTAYQAVDMLIGGGDFFVEENGSFYPFENEYPAEVLNRYINEGKIYIKIEAPWWDRYKGMPIMVRNSNDERWGYDVFFYYDKYNEKNKEKYPFMCNYFSYKFGRPLTKAEKDAIITEG